MPNKLILYLYFFVVALFLVSCSKETGPMGPTGNNGAPLTALTGDMKGTVTVYNVNGVAINDYSGVKVSLEGTSLSALSDATGNFSFEKLKSGTYNIRFEKEGFGTVRRLNVQHTGGTAYTRISNAEIGAIFNLAKIKAIDTVTYTNGYFWDINLFVYLESPVKLQQSLILYYHNTPDISSSVYSVVRRADKMYQQNDSTIAEGPLPSSAVLLTVNLYQLDSFYIAAAIDNKRSISYIDEKGVTIYPCTGPISAVLKVKNVYKK